MYWGVYIRGMSNRKSEHILFSLDQENSMCWWTTVGRYFANVNF